MANLSGTLSVLRVIFQPRLLVPTITVKSIRGLNFAALKEAGYRGAVFDKDNCLTLPDHDRLVPQLKEAWTECKQVFGPENILIVSNSAGTRSDPGLVQAESVSHHLGVSVLAHTTKKPGCIEPIKRHFASLPNPILLDVVNPRNASQSTGKIIVVGDRLMTDVLMANRMGHSAMAIWTNGLWVKEAMFLRWIEKSILHLLKYRARHSGTSTANATDDLHSSPISRFVKPETQGTRDLMIRASPQRWFTSLPRVLFGSTWQGLRWLFLRATESKEAKAIRKEREMGVDLVLRAERDTPRPTTLWTTISNSIRKHLARRTR
ncbi:hypothetical protein FRB99_008579 [Tulasnella sp. 403]|nr:hypothetical protein FRB99_008579 [Tulasnella sp. 403]